mmetsp:Transcript_10825/g.25650  ORF Transcript_10825/g.25650 Transcript_10825/m.25650 type:complete len:113 (+) Transcript_10825:4317-4655(+)
MDQASVIFFAKRHTCISQYSNSLETLRMTRFDLIIDNVGITTKPIHFISSHLISSEWTCHARRGVGQDSCVFGIRQRNDLVVHDTTAEYPIGLHSREWPIRCDAMPRNDLQY